MSLNKTRLFAQVNYSFLINYVLNSWGTHE